MTAMATAELPVELKSSHPKILCVQSLRGIAALSVAMYHTLNIVVYVRGAELPFHFVLSSGVDVFFVLSGFVMFITNFRGQHSPAKFIWNRFTRIVPLYWLCTLLFVPITLISPHLRPDFSVKNLLLSLMFIPYGHWPILPVGWSLNYEVFFYALLIGVMAISLRYMVMLSAIIYVILVIFGILLDPINIPWMYFYTRPIIFEFLVGIIIGWSFTNQFYIRTRATAIVCGVLAIGLFALSDHWGEEVWSNLQPVFFGIPAALLLLSALSLEQAELRVSNKGLLLLGDASYSIYLTHGFPLFVMAFVVKTAWWPKGTIGLLFFTSVVMALIICVGVSCHLYVEKPMIRKIRAYVANHFFRGGPESL